MKGFTISQMNEEINKRRLDARKNVNHALEKLVKGARLTILNGRRAIQVGLVALFDYDTPTNTCHGTQFQMNLAYNFDLTPEEVKMGTTEAHRTILLLLQNWDGISAVLADYDNALK